MRFTGACKPNRLRSTAVLSLVEASCFLGFNRLDIKQRRNARPNSGQCQVFADKMVVTRDPISLGTRTRTGRQPDFLGDTNDKKDGCDA